MWHPFILSILFPSSPFFSSSLILLPIIYAPVILSFFISFPFPFSAFCSSLSLPLPSVHCAPYLFYLLLFLCPSLSLSSSLSLSLTKFLPFTVSHCLFLLSYSYRVSDLYGGKRACVIATFMGTYVPTLAPINLYY